MFINGRQVLAGGEFEVHSPVDSSILLGYFQKGNAEFARKALEAANEHFAAWSSRPWKERVQLTGSRPTTPSAPTPNAGVSHPVRVPARSWPRRLTPNVSPMYWTSPGLCRAVPGRATFRPRWRCAGWGDAGPDECRGKTLCIPFNRWGECESN